MSDGMCFYWNVCSFSRRFYRCPSARIHETAINLKGRGGGKKGLERRNFPVRERDGMNSLGIGETRRGGAKEHAKRRRQSQAASDIHPSPPVVVVSPPPPLHHVSRAHYIAAEWGCTRGRERGTSTSSGRSVRCTEIWTLSSLRPLRKLPMNCKC